MTLEGWPEGAWGVTWDRADGARVQVWNPHDDMYGLLDTLLALMTEDEDA